MKKSVLALATLGAFAGAASAQSSVTLYGILDANVTYAESGDISALRGESRTLMNDGTANGKNGSRWGIRVSEDLGGGLRAVAVMESGFDVSQGTSNQGGRLFGRQAFVGLASSSLGEVRLGRQYTPSHELLGFVDPGDKGYSTNVTEAATFNGTGIAVPYSVQMMSNNGARRNNMAQYITPIFGGFQASGYVAAGEGTLPQAAGTDKSYGGKVQWTSGPFGVGVSYEELEGNATGNTYGKNLVVGGFWDFGIAKVMGGYNDVKDVEDPGTARTIKDQYAWSIGGIVPLGAFNILANYTETKYKLASVGNPERTLRKFGITGEYALSKRTFVYAQYDMKGGDLSDNITLTNQGGGETGKQNFGAGLRHAF